MSLEKDLTVPTKLKNTLQENLRLREELMDATNKQHQEMSRAIELNAKNCKLKKQIYRAKKEVFILQGKNVRNIQ
ncbi:unnamed protein product, partial [Brenthis ino]